MSLPDGVPVGCGIDYGSSNSAVALAFPDRVEVVGEAAGDPLAPSTLYLHRDGRRVAGARAPELFFRTGHERTICARCSLARYGVSDCRQFRRAGSCNDSRLLWSVKRDLANVGFAGTNSWATDFPVVELVAVTLALLRRRAERASGEEVTRVVLGHPVVFAGSDPENRTASDAEAFRRLELAATEAGFKVVEFLPEPTAAVIEGHAKNGIEVAVDFGGGTFDVAVLDSRTGSPRVAGTAGVAIGGEVLDGVLFDTIVGPALGLDGLPSWLVN